MKHTKILSEVVLQAEDDTVLLVKRSETDKKRPLQWDVPGGHVDDGEDFTLAAVREVVEETGIVVERSELNLAYTICKQSDEYNICWLFYVAKVNKQQPKLSHEHSDAVWVAMDEAINLVEYELQKNALIFIRDTLASR
jgi:dATP pyrophosphohydrolase